MSASKAAGLPSSEQLAIWRGFIETTEILRGRVETKLHEDSGLSTGDYRVLLALTEAEGRSLRSSELAAGIEWERSRLSGHLGRMEKRGLVRREPCAEDARGTRVFLTDIGAQAFRASTIPHLQAIRTFFVEAFGDADLARVVDITRMLRVHLGLPSRPRG